MPGPNHSVLKLRVKIYMAETPFSAGCMRIAYKCLVRTEDGSNVPGFDGQEMVFKMSR